jgi:5-methylcytosine-specific restriction endonuclease McrA
MPEQRITAEQKQAVLERARGCCEYCRSQARFATQSFSTEHIIPRHWGGETTLDNLALACYVLVLRCRAVIGAVCLAMTPAASPG